VAGVNGEAEREVISVDADAAVDEVVVSIPLMNNSIL
jgi:hypothetical protein